MIKGLRSVKLSFDVLWIGMFCAIALVVEFSKAKLKHFYFLSAFLGNQSMN